MVLEVSTRKEDSPGLLESSFEGLKSLIFLYSPMNNNYSVSLSTSLPLPDSPRDQKFPPFGQRKPRVGFRTDIRPTGLGRGLTGRRSREGKDLIVPWGQAALPLAQGTGVQTPG